MVFDHSLRVYMTAKKFTKKHTYICYRHTCIHTFIHIHTYVHTYIHKCIHYITLLHTCRHTDIHVHDSCWPLTLNRMAAKGLKKITVSPMFLAWTTYSPSAVL